VAAVEWSESASSGATVPLVLLIGLPGSGKSSLALRLQQEQPGCRVISTDQIRAELFGDESIQGNWSAIWQQIQLQFQQAVGQMRTGQTTLAIYDATNTRRRNRRQVIALARATGFTQIWAVWLHLPLEVCLSRNQQRLRQVPEPVMQRMARQLWSGPPRLREGIDRLLYYTAVPEPTQFWTALGFSSTGAKSTEISLPSQQEPNLIDG
jgi:predicted kinase